MTKLIFGCGFLGSRVAAQWLAEGHRVAALTRTAARAEELASQGIEPLVGDVTQPETLARLPAAETVLYAVSWDWRGNKSRHEVYVEGLRAALDAIRPPDKLIFISSTGVYGDAGGEWVDEDSPCRPTREAGRAFLDAERLLEQHPLGRRAVVLRMAGMYGPGRLMRQAELFSGRPMAVAAASYLNLVHVDDAARAVLAAERLAQPPCTYVVSDGQPADRREYFAHVARLLGAGPPMFCEPPPEGRAGRHDSDSKRVRSDRLRRELLVEFRYPSFREGLAAVFG